MFLTPSDTEKLLLSTAGMVARDRRERGVLLNYPEAVALLSCWMMERAREGATVAQLMKEGVDVLRSDEVMDGVADMVEYVQVEATFPDGRKLVTLDRPIRSGPERPTTVHPGELRTEAGVVDLNNGRETHTVVVRNDGDRPVQVGSHIHLADINRALRFFAFSDGDDEEPEEVPVTGFHADIAAGTSIRFQPGDEKRMDIVAFGGARKVAGLQVANTAGRGSGE